MILFESLDTVFYFFIP